MPATLSMKRPTLVTPRTHLYSGISSTPPPYPNLLLDSLPDSFSLPHHFHGYPGRTTTCEPRLDRGPADYSLPSLLRLLSDPGANTYAIFDMVGRDAGAAGTGDGGFVGGGDVMDLGEVYGRGRL